MEVRIPTLSIGFRGLRDKPQLPEAGSHKSVARLTEMVQIWMPERFYGMQAGSLVIELGHCRMSYLCKCFLSYRSTAASSFGEATSTPLYWKPAVNRCCSCALKFFYASEPAAAKEIEKSLAGPLNVSVFETENNHDVLTVNGKDWL